MTARSRLCAAAMWPLAAFLLLGRFLPKLGGATCAAIFFPRMAHPTPLTPPLCPHLFVAMTFIQRSDRLFVALRKQGPTPRGRAPLFHAVTPNCRIALCCAEPGTSSEWAEPPAAAVTCRQCLRRLEKL